MSLQRHFLDTVCIEGQRVCIPWLNFPQEKTLTKNDDYLVWWLLQILQTKDQFLIMLAKLKKSIIMNCFYQMDLGNLHLWHQHGRGVCVEGGILKFASCLWIRLCLNRSIVHFCRCGGWGSKNWSYVDALNAWTPISPNLLTIKIPNLTILKIGSIAFSRITIHFYIIVFSRYLKQIFISVATIQY